MIPRSPRGPAARSGITLTEILISILIMGIGLISLATLFPLGLIRLRDASRFHRGGLLVQSATDDMDARSLLYKPSFQQTWYGTSFDPFTSDAVVNGNTPIQTNSSSNPLPGLPIAYDPLWRAVTNIVPQSGALNDPTLSFNVKTYCNGAYEARFGCGVVYSPAGAVFNPFNMGLSPGDVGTPSAHGLQRITNFIPWDTPANGANALYPFTYANMAITGAQAPDVAGDTFSSIDDVVFNAADGGVNAYSPLLPDMQYAGNPVVDWRYTWFFTGRQVDSTNNTMFQGEIVVTDGRPFGFEPMVDSAGATTPPVATGETLVEAIFGFSTNVNAINSGNIANTGFANGSDRTVLIRWPVTIPDPQVRIGSWIADVTYERDGPTSATKTAASGTTFQRCYWYQIVKRTDGETETAQATGPRSPLNYRRMTLTLATPVRAKTLLYSSGQANAGSPYYTNVALIMPSVINVFPRAFQIH